MIPVLNNTEAQNLLSDLMTLYVIPEIERRGLPRNFNLHAAQIIFWDTRPCQVRINDEIKAIAKVRLKSGVSKQKNDPIYENEVEGLNEITLSETEDPNCAHVTLVRIENTWTIVFDFRYNRGFAQKCIDAAKQFCETADFAREKRLWYSYLDNLFSAAELAAKAILMLMPGTGFARKSRHRSIQFRYNRFADLGNVREEFRRTLNQLSGLRDNARYLKGDLRLDEVDINKFSQIVKDMIQDTEKRIGTKK